MKLWEKLKERWRNWDRFEKHILSSFLIFIIIMIFMAIFFPRSLDGPLKWISETFSVPLIKGKGLSLDATDILFFFFVGIILISF